jgi:hypothetical protein
VEYEIDFIQDQRRIDDDDDTFDSKGVLESDDFGVVDPSKLVQGSGEWQVQNKKRARNKITFKIRKQLQSEDVMTDEEEVNIRDVWELPITDRWRLYRKWVTDISQQHQNTIALIQDEYDGGMKELQELYNAKNYELLREAHVIGMTTTGKYHHNIFVITITMEIITIIITIGNLLNDISKIGTTENTAVKIKILNIVYIYFIFSIFKL